MKRLHLLFAIAANPILLLAQSPEPIRLSLKQAVDLALAPDASARIDLANQLIEQSRTRANQARAALLPNVDATVAGQNFTRNLAAFGVRSPVPGVAFPEIVGPLTVFDGRATLTQTVFDFAAITRWKAAKAAIDTARSEEEAARNDTAEQVARAYMATLRASAALDAARANLDLSEANAALAERRKNAGTATGIDVTRAQVQAANDRQRLLAATHVRRRAELVLLRAIGAGMEVAVVDLTDTLQYTPPDPVPVDEAIGVALDARADLRVQRRRQTAAALSYDAIRAERYPSIAAFADAGNIGLSLGETRFTRTLGLSLRVPLFDGGRRDARRAEASIAIRQEAIRERDIRRQIELEVRSAFEDLASAGGQVKVAEEGLTLANRELEQARRRFDAGVAPGIEPIDAQTRVARARANRDDALYLHNLAKIELAAATGTIRKVIQ
ncbi:MAG: TolC family protein [Bryobacteraceae bacterium]